MRRLPIAVRITLVAAAAVAAALLLVSVLFRSSLRRTGLAELNRSALARLDQVTELCVDGALHQKISAPRDSPLMVQVLDRSGVVVAATQNVGDMHAMIPKFEFSDSDLRVATRIDGVRARVFGRKVESSGHQWTVLVAAPTRTVDAADAALKRQLLIFGPVVLGLSTLTVLMVARRALRPVDKLRAEVDAVTPMDLSARVSVPAVNDEVARLSSTMNSLLDRVEHASIRQGRFVSDASHELRSPLAAIRTRLEVGLRNPDTSWPPLVTNVLTEHVRLERLVNNLLFLARGDSGARRTPMMAVDLDDVVMQEIESLRTYSRVPIDASGVSAARVLGNPDQLRRVIVNLLDNAQRHAKSEVCVSLSRDGDHAVVRVADDGPGIAPEDRERVFERFTRIDDARTRSDGGSGLGLALVREIVSDHNGTVVLGPREPNGTEAVVRIPIES